MRPETPGSEGKQRTPSQMKWEGESREKLEPSNFTLSKVTGRARTGCWGRGSPENEAEFQAPLLGQGVAAAGLGRSCWVGMLQLQAAKECSPLSINLAFQQSWPTCCAKLQLGPLSCIIILQLLAQGQGSCPQIAWKVPK